MKKNSSLAALLLTVAGLFVAPTIGGAQNCPAVPYEPESVTQHVKIAVATSRHPSGKRVTYPVLQLNSPVTVSGGGKRNAVNVPEECVGEIQLWAEDAKGVKRLLALRSKHVAISGALQHAHTDW